MLRPATLVFSRDRLRSITARPVDTPSGDFFGIARPQGAAVDIGAYEHAWIRRGAVGH